MGFVIILIFIFIKLIFRYKKKKDIIISSLMLFKCYNNNNIKSNMFVCKNIILVCLIIVVYRDWM